MRDVSKSAQAVRNTAIRLLEIAAEMEGRPLPRTAATTRAKGCTCDVCGEQLKGLNWVGRRCESSRLNGEQCRGVYRLDPEPVRVVEISIHAPGHPEPDLVTLSDGRVLPVTTAQLALSQAAQDFRLAGEAACLLYDGDEDLEAIRAGGGS